MAQLPHELAIQPIDAFDARLRVPGSKSLTNRALLLAALAQGESTLTGVLFSDDTRIMLDALATLGFELAIDEAAQMVKITGQAGSVPHAGCQLFLGNAGTAYRFLAAACCLAPASSENQIGSYLLDGIERMRQRPIGQLVDALRELGAGIAYEGEVGYPPLSIRQTGLQGKTLTLQPTLSSQYISALLQVGPYCKNGLTLQFDGAVTSRPYVDMTIRLMQRFGVKVSVDDAFTQVTVEPGVYQGQAYDIEPDASNASYFLAAAAILPESRCCIMGLHRNSLQGDVRFADMLARMGASVHWEADAIEVRSPVDDVLHGIDVDLNDMPDMAQTLAAVAMFADAPTTIRNVGNLRVKETDRMAALQIELTKLGGRVLISGDDLIIQPPRDGRIQPAVIDTYDDHRMAMSFALIGLRSPGVVIRDPACVHKTFPNFFEYLTRLR